ncbi:hypothetical protein BGX24_004668 [Mortierella sp. AD032]|nr:hypothetical protein BGX24_004668 [Mortierella sp. AD032]
MLRRDPTRIELRAEDLLDFDRAREEYLDSIATNNNNTANKNKKHKATAAGPPPTPANQTTITSRKPDPVELAERERRGKSAKERIFGDYINHVSFKSTNGDH